LLLSSPIVFPRVTIRRAVLKPHSRLYCLEPVGVGTPLVESLTSYMCRLAAAHSWRVSTLCAYELQPHLGMPFLFATTESMPATFSSRRMFNVSPALVSTSNAAAKFVDALEHLTKRQDLRFLTLLSWDYLLPRRYLIRKFKAWCPDCYQELLESGRTVYEPLLWAIAAVEICSRHRKSLVSRCPHCGRQTTYVRSRSRVGYCPWCEKWLGGSTNPDTADRLNIGKPDFDFQFWVVDSVGQLLASTSTLQVMPEQENIVKSISVIIDSIYQGVTSRLAKDIGRCKASVFGWRNGKNKPSLVEMLVVSYNAGISLRDFLYAEGAIKSGQFILQISSSKKNPKRTFTTPRKLLDRISVESMLKQYLEPGVVPLPLCEVSKRMGYGTKLLRRYYPALSKRISQRFLRHLKQSRRQRRVDFFNEIVSAVYQLHSSGQPVTRAGVAELLNKPEYRNYPQVVKPMREAKRQLGIL
jgi:hypothetical protein